MSVIGGSTTDEQRLRLLWKESLAEHMAERRVDGVLKPMTRKELHQALRERGVNVSRQAVDYWLAGKTAPRLSLQAHIAAVLGVPVRRLFPIEAAA